MARISFLTASCIVTALQISSYAQFWNKEATVEFTITAIAAYENTLLLGTAEDGLLSYNSGEFSEMIKFTQPPAFDAIKYVAVSSRSSIFAATNNKIYKRSNDEWTVIENVDDRHPNPDVCSIGDIFAIDSADTLHYIVGCSETQFSELYLMPGNYMVGQMYGLCDIAASRTGDIWYAFTFYDGPASAQWNWIPFETATLPNMSIPESPFEVHQIIFDNDDRMWASGDLPTNFSGGSLCMLADTGWVLIGGTWNWTGISGTTTEKARTSLMFDNHDLLWAVSEDRVSCHAPEQLQSEQDQPQIFDEKISGLVQDQRGSLWLATSHALHTYAPYQAMAASKNAMHMQSAARGPLRENVHVMCRGKNASAAGSPVMYLPTGRSLSRSSTQSPPAAQAIIGKQR